jgi:hypothetical protein
LTNDILPKDYPDFNEHGTPPCAESFPDAFFSEEQSVTVMNHKGKPVLKTWSKYEYEKEAKAICAECPYKIACLEYAIKYNELGIWGGTTENQRKNMRTARNLEPNRRGRPKVQ